MNKKTLRLIVTYKCDRNCIGCCNKQTAFLKNSIEIFNGDFSIYDEIIITGGEPLLYDDELEILIRGIKFFSSVPIYVYSAHVEYYYCLLKILMLSDGMTITIHNEKDLRAFMFVDTLLENRCNYLNLTGKSLRLNVFKEAGMTRRQKNDLSSHWKIKNNIKWIEDCPLPSNENIYKLEKLF